MTEEVVFLWFIMTGRDNISGKLVFIATSVARIKILSMDRKSKVLESNVL